jgi:serine phosphatase RsbU (regulator of sigma subunit)
MEIHISISKIRKYAVSASGDTVEVVERPNGGLSVVIADGQSSGKGAKTVSSMVVRKVIGLLAEGVRDGAAARAASDTLFTERGGKVSATLNIISIDQITQTVVITRNNPSPALIALNGEIRILEEESRPVGFYRGTRPVISEIDLEPGLIALVFTDGLVHAGKRRGEPMDVVTSFRRLVEDDQPSAQVIADSLLEEAVRLDDQRPVDDISVVVVQVVPRTGDHVRRMTVSLPMDS